MSSKEDSFFALGTIVEKLPQLDPRTYVSNGMLDYYDRWNTIDPRLAAHHKFLSRASDVFGHDLVNMATYTREILNWLDQDRIHLPESVVVVGGMAEAFLVSIRSAYDALAIAIAYVACEKLGQAPSDSLRDLIDWTKKHKTRARPRVYDFLLRDHEGFWTLRTLRDALVHKGAHAVIHTDRRQFNLWLHDSNRWVTREPLLPLLASRLSHLLSFAGEAAAIINDVIDMPRERMRSRVVHGVFIGSLHKLIEIQSQYAGPSP